MDLVRITIQHRTVLATWVLVRAAHLGRRRVERIPCLTQQA